jgi:hypothetical protein
VKKHFFALDELRDLLGGGVPLPNPFHLPDTCRGAPESPPIFTSMHNI